jgi:predicted RNase H-like HicB family nuclease
MSVIPAVEEESLTLPVTIEFLEEDEIYVVSCPLLQGCRAWGETLDEALRAMPGNIRAMIEARRSQGSPLPETLQDIDLSRPLVIKVMTL